MYKILRIVCCIISALLLAGCVFFFVYLGNVWGIASVIGAAAFFALTILFKSLQEEQQAKAALNKNESAPEAAENEVKPDDAQTPSPAEPAKPDENEDKQD